MQASSVWPKPDVKLTTRVWGMEYMLSNSRCSSRQEVKGQMGRSPVSAGVGVWGPSPPEAASLSSSPMAAAIGRQSASATSFFTCTWCLLWTFQQKTRQTTSGIAARQINKLSRSHRRRWCLCLNDEACLAWIREKHIRPKIGGTCPHAGVAAVTEPDWVLARSNARFQGFDMVWHFLRT